VDASYFTLNFANGFSTPTANDIAIYLNNQMVFEFVCDGEADITWIVKSLFRVNAALKWIGDHLSCL